MMTLYNTIISDFIAVATGLESHSIPKTTIRQSSMAMKHWQVQHGNGLQTFSCYVILFLKVFRFVWNANSPQDITGDATVMIVPL